MASMDGISTNTYMDPILVCNRNFFHGFLHAFGTQGSYVWMISLRIRPGGIAIQKNKWMTNHRANLNFGAPNDSEFSKSGISSDIVLLNLDLTPT